MTTVNDPNLNLKVKKSKVLRCFLSFLLVSFKKILLFLAVEKISENMHIIANEPSLAFYRIQEHVRKVLPLVVDRRSEVEVLQQELQGKVSQKYQGLKKMLFLFISLSLFV